MAQLSLLSWATRTSPASSVRSLPGFLQPAGSQVPAALQPTTPGPKADFLTLSPAASQPTSSAVSPTTPAIAPGLQQATSDTAAFNAAQSLLNQALVAITPAPPPSAVPAAPKAAPTPKPDPAAPTPAPAPTQAPAPSASDALKNLSSAQLAHLGATDKQAFFDALRPAADEAEKQYGVPAAVTLAQAALESGWGAHAIGGFNIFGIKGHGPAGTVNVGTQEYQNGHYVNTTANFAKYNNFYEAVTEHGKTLNNGYYKKALADWQKNHDVSQFANDLTGVYATSPTYGSSLMNIINNYHLA